MAGWVILILVGVFAIYMTLRIIVLAQAARVVTKEGARRRRAVAQATWHALSIQEVLQALDTGPEGLTEAQAEERLSQYGPNTIEAEQGTNKIALLLEQIKNPLVIVLIVAAAISLLIGEMVDAAVIGVVLVLNTTVGFYQEYKAEQAIEALRAQAAPEAEVLRCWSEQVCIERRIRASEVVPGDVILLDAGDKVPADARIVSAANLEIDESMLTGESVPVRKEPDPLEPDLPVAEWTNIAFAGTIVTLGRGQAVVYTTGVTTEMGKIAKLIEETEKAESPLQRQMFNLGRILGLFALAASLLTLLLGLLRGFVFQEIFLFALATAVSAIPEGLPAVMTVTLAVGVSRMARRNAIIRRLRAVDTLGAATVICTDKTGTLTTNQMTVQRILVGGKLVHVTGVGYAPAGRFEVAGKPAEVEAGSPLERMLRAAALCSDAHLVDHETGEGTRWEIRGDPTEGALVVAAAKAGLSKEHLEEVFPRIDEIPFSSKSRYMATFHRTPEGRADVYVKGAPEVVLSMCSSLLVNGEEQELTGRRKDEILEQQTRMAADALRVLAVACQTIELDAVKGTQEALRQGTGRLVFLGLAGMIDPPRLEVPEAVERCKMAGIRVIMATGDHRLTAEAIARQVGIMEGEGGVFTGSDVERWSDKELDKVLRDASVFARVSPGHKYRLVESLRRQGHVVAMTGDGINDAPALEAAEIGVAMGITGTDVTKETADMVLVDDNFTSIVNAAEEGRVVFQNVRKVVRFLIATNLGEILTILASLILFVMDDLILTPVQILWVNLVTDGLLVIPLALEPQEADVMHQPPRKPDAPIIQREILLNAVYVSVFMAVGTLGLFVRASNAGRLPHAQTVAFTTIAVFQVFNALNCRSPTRSVFQLGMFSNPYLLGAIVLSVLLQVLASQLPILQTALGTEPLPPGDWALIVLVSSTVLVADEIRKWVQRRRKPALPAAA